MAPKALGKLYECLKKAHPPNTAHPRTFTFMTLPPGRLLQCQQQTWKSSIQTATKCTTTMMPLLTSPCWMTYPNAPSSIYWANPPILKKSSTTSPNLPTTSPLVNQVYLLKCSRHGLLKASHMYANSFRIFGKDRKIMRIGKWLSSRFSTRKMTKKNPPTIMV